MNHTVIFVSIYPQDVQLLPSDAMRYQLITATHSEVIHGMRVVPGDNLIVELNDVKFRVNRDIEFFTKMVKKYSRQEEDCIFATKGDAVTYISRNDAKQFIESKGNGIMLDVTKLYEYLYKDREIYLIVGSTDGLKSELIKDIRVTCKKAGFDETFTNTILQKCNCDDNEECKQVVERSQDTVLRIIVSPTVKEFKDFMKQALLLCCSRFSLKIVYCGHGTIAGRICLFDEDYSGAELLKLLKPTKISNYPVDVGLYLNCCHAINIVSKIAEKDALQLMKNFASLILDNADGSTCILKAYHGDQKENDKFQKNYISKMGQDSLLRIKWSNQILKLFPLSVGSLKADGLLYVALGVDEDLGVQENEPLCRFRTKWYQQDGNSLQLDSLFTLKPPSNPQSNENPSIKVFCANRGDSSLFSWKMWNVLIDGGLTNSILKPPCFREEICKLKKLDLVVLTHGDADHVNGLLPFFKKLSNDKKRKKPKFVTYAAFLHNGMQLSGNRGWSSACELYKYATEAGIKCCTSISQHLEYSAAVNDRDRLEIHFIHPPLKSELLDKALSELKKDDPTRTSPINAASMVVYIECLVDDVCKHRLLFTGDADGVDVITALRKKKLLDKEFSYVDMPHHGSDLNNPEHFLSYIKAKNIVVSTNGKPEKYKHPGETTITALCDYMERNDTCNLYFNYNQPKYVERLQGFGARVQYGPYHDDDKYVPIEF